MSSESLTQPVLFSVLEMNGHSVLKFHQISYYFNVYFQFNLIIICTIITYIFIQYLLLLILGKSCKNFQYFLESPKGPIVNLLKILRITCKRTKRDHPYHMLCTLQCLVNKPLRNFWLNPAYVLARYILHPPHTAKPALNFKVYPSRQNF